MSNLRSSSISGCTVPRPAPHPGQRTSPSVLASTHTLAHQPSSGKWELCREETVLTINRQQFTTYLWGQQWLHLGSSVGLGVKQQHRAAFEQKHGILHRHQSRLGGTCLYGALAREQVELEVCGSVELVAYYRGMWQCGAWAGRQQGWVAFRSEQRVGRMSLIVVSIGVQTPQILQQAIPPTSGSTPDYWWVRLNGSVGQIQLVDHMFDTPGLSITCNFTLNYLVCLMWILSECICIITHSIICPLPLQELVTQAIWILNLT